MKEKPLTEWAFFVLYFTTLTCTILINNWNTRRIDTSKVKELNPIHTIVFMLFSMCKNTGKE